MNSVLFNQNGAPTDAFDLDEETVPLKQFHFSVNIYGNCELCHYLPKSKSELRHSPFELSNICSFGLDTNIIFTKRKLYVDKNSRTKCRKVYWQCGTILAVLLFFNCKG